MLLSIARVTSSLGERNFIKICYEQLLKDFVFGVMEARLVQ